MTNLIESLLIGINEVVHFIDSINNVYWNGNYAYFLVFVVCVVFLLFNKKQQEFLRCRQMMMIYTIILATVFIYNPLFKVCIQTVPGFDEAVFARVWLIAPIWLIMSIVITELVNRFDKTVYRYLFAIITALIIVAFGSSMDAINYMHDSLNDFKIQPDSVLIANEILKYSDGNNTDALIVYVSDNAGNTFEVDGNTNTHNFEIDGTVYGGVVQYTGKIHAVSLALTPDVWEKYYTSSYTPEGITSQEYVHDIFTFYRRWRDFRFVAMPADESLITKMTEAGYVYKSSVGGYYIFEAIDSWTVSCYSENLVNNNKLYVIQDYAGHCIFINGGRADDFDEIKTIIAHYGNHVDAWIFTNTADSNLEVLYDVLSNDSIQIDQVFMPYINQDYCEQMELNGNVEYANIMNLLSDNCDCIQLHAGDNLQLYGLEISMYSDSGSWDAEYSIENSMIFQISNNSESILFCSYARLDQIQSVLSENLSTNKPTYIQIDCNANIEDIAELINLMQPKTVFVDGISDDNYLLLTSLIGNTKVYSSKWNSPKTVELS